MRDIFEVLVVFLTQFYVSFVYDEHLKIFVFCGVKRLKVFNLVYGGSYNI